MMEFNGYTVQFTFDENETGYIKGDVSGKMLKYRGAVVATVNCGGDILDFFGKSYCSVSDKFDRVIGAREALRNVSHGFIDDVARAEMWQAFVEYIPVIERGGKLWYAKYDYSMRTLGFSASNSDWFAKRFPSTQTAQATS